MADQIKVGLTTPVLSLHLEVIKLQHPASTLEERQIPRYDYGHEDTKTPCSD